MTPNIIETGEMVSVPRESLEHLRWVASEVFSGRLIPRSHLPKILNSVDKTKVDEE